MKIKESVLLQIKENVRIKNLLALALNRSAYTITRWIEDPEDDNLTKAAALKVIREETGLSDAEILEEEKVSEGLGR